MQSAEPYDPTPDLEAQRPKGGARIGLLFMLLTAIAELGAFLQCKLIGMTGETYVVVWIWLKLVVALLAFAATVRTTRLGDGTVSLYALAAVAALFETGSWLAFTLLHGMFSCFPMIALVPAALCTLTLFPVRQAAMEAEAARARLEAGGIDGAF